MRWIKFFILSIFLAIVAGGISIVGVLFYYTKDLPDYNQLSNYQPAIVSRLYAADGKLMEEYAKENRLYVSIHAIPQQLIHAFLAAEDKNFFQHSGIDMYSIFRAGVTNIMNYGREGQMVGGSTITQQVVKNFLLSNERTLERKVKEAVLAVRITRSFSKEQILELYLNQIYLGNRSYGVAAAALNYFNKSINELTPEEMALLASMPKAPSEFNPYRNYKRAKERRDWVLSRMLDEKYITKEAYQVAIEAPIRLRSREQHEIVKADFYAEEVRRRLLEKYGEKILYEGGLSVHTNLDPTLQEQATQALIKGIISFDHRKGWRGPLKHIPLSSSWAQELQRYNYSINNDWQIAIVLSVSQADATIGFKDKKTGIIPLSQMTWASHEANPSAASILHPGDIIAVSAVLPHATSPSTLALTPPVYTLQQIPEVNGAVVVMDPHTGQVKALVGGFSSKDTQFNRATQAMRQPGSAFKPFVYLAAMEKGFTPATIVVDSPVELDQGPGLPMWRPKNYSGEFFGPTPLRRGLEASRNAMTVQLAQMLGVDSIVEISKRFGVLDNPAANYSMVLGAAETTLLRITSGYAMIINGGKRVSPILVERIQDRKGATIFRRDNRLCDECSIKEVNQLTGVFPPVLADDRQQITDPQSAYQVISMMEGVVKRGTAMAALRLGKTVGGKTGTTNNSYDTWFIGFTPDIVVGTYIGYDIPKTLGKKETGASVSLPVFIDFMEHYLKDKSDIPFRIPEGISLVRIDRLTGQVPGPDTPESNIMYEAFKSKNNPLGESTTPVNVTGHDSDSPVPSDNSLPHDTEGIY
ncbi:MAG: penicillin-binding protein 1A [Alphaproteobacteria bacterium]|nr:penicillin-binding protein 1A [Alphaproteobacteria bacterium]